MKRDVSLVVFALVTGVITGQGHILRLSDHAGYWLVPVETATDTRPGPERAFVIVVDGLRQDFAARMQSAKAIEAHGVCASTDVGAVTLSRPVYAVLSTGLAQERTGARANADSAPLAADSIWQSARRAGWHVRGYSELWWWQDLFPNGFDRYEVVEAEPDLFAHVRMQLPPQHSLTLIHPVYVDETAHSFGAASEPYERAVARVDREIARFLDRIDWEKDLVVITADHGHVDKGGHGGRQPEISSVLTCFGGRGVRHGPRIEDFDMRAVAPAMSVLLGTAFPRHMQGEHLEQVAQITGAAFQERTSELALIAAANTKALAAWGALSWPEHRASQEQRQWLRGAIGLLLIAAFVLWRLRLAALWLLGLWGITVGVVAFERGAFDLTAINGQTVFILATATAASVVLSIFAWLHRRLLADRSLTEDLRVLVAATVALALVHVAAYGWPMGYPLPPPELVFAPFVIAIAIGVYVVGYVLASRVIVKAR